MKAKLRKTVLVASAIIYISCSSTHSKKKVPVEKSMDDAALLSPSAPAPKGSGLAPHTLSFLWPIEGKPRIASFFGWRKKGRRKNSGERMHEGLDIGGNQGQNIYASAEGRVIDVAYVRGYGRTVIVYHGGGWSTLYAHLSKYKVKKGQEVGAGDLIGLMGHTGRAEANHLHFEVRKGADPLDPLLFLPSRELEKYSPHNFLIEDE